MIEEFDFNGTKISLLDDVTKAPYKIIVFVGENGGGKTTLLRYINKQDPKSLFIYQDIKYRQALRAAGNEMGKVINGKDIFGNEIIEPKKNNDKILEVVGKYFPNSIVSDSYSDFEGTASIFSGIGKQVGTTQIVGDDFHIPEEAHTKLDTRSSGEQEFLLKLLVMAEKFNENSTLLLLDEPETGLHPKWQQQTLNVFLDCLTDNQQLIVATHSENILKVAMSSPNCLIIKVSKVDKDNFELQNIKDTERVLPYLSFSEIQNIVFGMSSLEYHNELYGEIQNRYLVDTVKGCDDFLISHSSYITNVHFKSTSYTHQSGNVTDYSCISTWIRNEIHHPPATGKNYNEENLQNSIEFMRNILNENSPVDATIVNIVNEFDSDLDFDKYKNNLGKGGFLSNGLIGV